MLSFFDLPQAGAHQRAYWKNLLIRPVSVLVYGTAFIYFCIALVTGHVQAGLFAVVLGVFTVHVVRRTCNEVQLDVHLENGAEWLDEGLISKLPLDVNIHALTVAAVETLEGRRLVRVMGVDASKAVTIVEKQTSIELLPLLETAKQLAEAVGDKRINGATMLAALFVAEKELEPLLNEADLTTDDVRRLLRMERIRQSFTYKPPRFSPDGLRRQFGSIGRSWVAGYTNALDQVSTDVHTDKWMHREGLVVAHVDVMQSILHVLSRKDSHNALLLGRPGVGKTALIQNAMTQLRILEQNEGLPPARIVELSTQMLISARSNPDAILLRALTEAETSGHVILIIHNITQFILSASEPMKAVISKFLVSPSIHIIATADNESYHSIIKQNPGFDAAFEKFLVEDASDDDTFSVLLLTAFKIENETRLTVSYKALMSVIDLSKRYLTAAGGMPGRAVAVLEEAALLAAKKGGGVVAESDVRDVVSLKAKMNIQKMTDGDRQMLLTLEDRMKRRIIGQDEAISVLVSALKRARLDIHGGKRPIGTFMFLGPTGVGKTQTAKVLAEEYFGSVDALVRLDMNEFSTEASVAGIIGSTDGGDRSEGFLAKRVQDRPFSVILLDELEKAHPRVLNLFLQVLDEGFLMDATGARTDFRNTIIIATTNAGALFIRDFIAQHGSEDRETLKGSLIDAIIRERTFSPEFLNRFDATVLYYPMTPQVADTLGRMLVGEIVSDVQRKKGITVNFSDAFVESLVKKGYSEQFGAREMRRVMTENVENAIADELLKRDVKRGDTITIGN